MQGGKGGCGHEILGNFRKSDPSEWVVDSSTCATFSQRFKEKSQQEPIFNPSVKIMPSDIKMLSQKLSRSQGKVVDDESEDSAPKGAKSAKKVVDKPRVVRTGKQTFENFINNSKYLFKSTHWRALYVKDNKKMSALGK